MKKELNTPIKEETYEQFDTDEITPKKNHKKITYFSPNQIIKYILLTFVILCLIILLFNLTQNQNISNNFESKSNSKKLSSPLRDDFNFINEPQFLEDSITLDYSVKGSYISKQSNEHITLITILLVVEKKCSKDNCLDCYINGEINYPELSEKEAFDKIYKEMGLRDTWVENIYCQQHNPQKPKGDYSNQVHFVWNKYKRKMIPIKGVYYIDDDIAKRYNNEYLQAAIQGYEFTIIDHIYEKNNKNYKYNDLTLSFDEIKLNIKCKKSYECSIGDNENCKTCDSEEKKNCDSCNDGYYLSKDDKTKCIKSIIKDDDVINYPELSEKEAFDKIYKEMGLRDTFVENIYCQQHNPKKPKGDYSNQVHFVWNKYKRKMIPIKGVYYIDDDIAKIHNNEYLQAVIQGYEFTFMDHIYEKNKKFYKYNDIKLNFDEINFDL
jgi:hypothetical protein